MTSHSGPMTSHKGPMLSHSGPMTSHSGPIFYGFSRIFRIFQDPPGGDITRLGRVSSPLSIGHRPMNAKRKETLICGVPQGSVFLNSSGGAVCFVDTWGRFGGADDGLYDT